MIPFTLFKVFGTKKSLWLFPLFSEDDLEKIPALHGLEFPTRSDVDAWGFIESNIWPRLCKPEYHVAIVIILGLNVQSESLNLTT